MRRSLSSLMLLVALPVLAGDASESDTGPLPEAGEVIRKFVEQAGLVVTNSSTGILVYYRTNITKEFTRKGKLDETEELLLRVTAEGEFQDVELLQINGRTPTQKERERELKRFGGHREASTRRERPDRSKQLDAYLNMEVLGRYLFTVDGRETVEGWPCFKVSFKPGGREAKSDKLFERVLDRLTGVFWIDANDYQLAKADIQLSEHVSLWGGVLGGLEHLRLQIQRVRDGHGVWRDQAVEARFVGRAVTRHIDVWTLDQSSTPEPVQSEPVVAAE